MEETEEERQARMAAVEKLATSIVELAVDQNPTMDTLFDALAAAVVGFSIQYVHAGTGDLKHEDVTQHLARFYAHTVDLSMLKLQHFKEQLTSASP